jgi:hypothetical protein
VFEDWVLAQESKFEAVVAGIKPVLDCIGFEPPKGTVLLPGDRPPRSILNRCQGAWEDFKGFTRCAANYIVIHTLAIVRSHYPSVKPEVIMTGFVRGTSAAKITKLEDEAEEAVAKLVGDVDLFGEGENNAE